MPIFSGKIEGENPKLDEQDLQINKELNQMGLSPQIEEDRAIKAEIDEISGEIEAKAISEEMEKREQAHLRHILSATIDNLRYLSEKGMIDSDVSASELPDYLRDKIRKLETEMGLKKEEGEDE